MADVTQTPLPGVGVRLDFTTASGDRIGVIAHRTGRRDVLLYDQVDVDSCIRSIPLDDDDTRTLASLLGASPVDEAVASLQEMEGVAIDWIEVAQGSAAAGQPVRLAAPRSETKVAIVALLRGGETIAVPGPDDVLEAGDVAVVVGRADDIQALSPRLRGH